MHKLLLTLLLSQPVLACGAIPPTLWSLTRQAANEQGLEAELLGALVWIESRYCVDAVSPQGAVGLGQLMPGTARALGVDATDPAQNLTGSARYLLEQYLAFGTWELALAAYNAGPGTVQRYGGLPPYDETRRYVTEVLQHYEAFRVQTHSREEVRRGLGVYRRQP